MSANGTFLTEVFFEKNSENASSQKMVESEDQWYHHKLLLKSFPMNGHVNML
jgi:hypothetical protein